MQTLPLSRLAPALRAMAKGDPYTEAAIELLITHGTWLRRPEFHDALVEHETIDGTARAWIIWSEVTDFLKVVGCASSEARILRLCTELAGTATSTSLAHNLAGLDDTNA